MTIRECAIIEAYTGFCMLAGEKRIYFYEYIQEKLKRPVYTHELAKKEMWEKIKNAAYEDFVLLCKTADEPCERRSQEQAILDRIEQGKGLEPLPTVNDLSYKY